METIIIKKKGQMKILEVKNTVTEESICWSKQQTKQSREKICELENTSIETIKTKTQV